MMVYLLTLPVFAHAQDLEVMINITGAEPTAAIFPDVYENRIPPMLIRGAVPWSDTDEQTYCVTLNVLISDEQNQSNVVH